MMPTQFVVVVGNVVDGFAIAGPFDSRAAAEDSREAREIGSRVMTLLSPESTDA